MEASFETNAAMVRMELSVAQFVDLTQIKPGSRIQLTMGRAKGSYAIYSIRQPQQAQPSLEEVG